ncbi:thiamine pyridinylase [Burkholderia plantarii]|uniref:Thiaminase I n=1 Tax=Burkholderia plantarii TaxID=41899 RepID=A0A0B6RYI3_BURPL|nr:thiamine pyridinylase [Burkholderia plantarii]AJK50397.1 thiaminase I precursor [Burkholderia plantarii]ALK34574.1 putative thiaminase I [Burkholderia plantarii]WLE63600.1 thiamine pyridinylase [Burkholderia plantarii]
MRRMFCRFMLAVGCWLAILPYAFAGAPQQLTVALYPWVPRVDQFQQAIETEWKKVHPEIALQFVPDSEWDGGYSGDPPASADVYIYDAIFFDYFRSKNWLEPLAASEVQNIGDYLPYAIDGVKVGDRYYSLPQLGCANLLFYHKHDAALAAATTLTQVHAALQQCTYTSEMPPDRRGLMFDMSGGTTSSALYLDAAHSQNGAYPLPLPWSAAQLDPDAVASLRTLLAMASFPNATASLPGQYDRSVWFSNGEGRAVIGYSESMSAMSEATRQDIDFKIMPLSDHAEPPLFYADVIGVNTTTNLRGTRALAVQLANLIAASTTMLESIGPDASAVPQYLFATRRSVLDTLAASYPLYAKMNALLDAAGQPEMFKLDAQARNWLDTMSPPIQQSAQANYVCGCDIDTTRPIADYRAAQAVCPAVCSAQGGWNGQWTNRQPAAPAGTSACGCNACPTSAPTASMVPAARTLKFGKFAH